MQKAQTENITTGSSTAVHDDGSTTLEGQLSNLSTKDADDNASTRGVRSTTHSPNPSQLNGSDVPNGIPTIRISTESQREAKQQDGIDEQHPDTNGIHEPEESSQVTTDSLEKPVQAAAGEGNDDAGGPSPSQSEAFSFSNKRLCERWLDNLFMVLYEVSPFE